MPNRSSLTLQIALLIVTVLYPCAAFANVGELFLYEKGGGHVGLEHYGRSFATRLRAENHFNNHREELAAVAVKLTPPLSVKSIQLDFHLNNNTRNGKHSSSPLIKLEYTSAKDTKLRYSTIEGKNTAIDIPKVIGTDAIVHRFAVIAAPDQSEDSYADFNLVYLRVNRELVHVIRPNVRLRDDDFLVEHE